VLEGATSIGDLGANFGGDLYEREVAYLMEQEWAESADDILWRRSKLGLHVAHKERAALEDFLASSRGKSFRAVAAAAAP
jgi:glycerol-3-phosphate dehydrogenase